MTSRGIQQVKTILPVTTHMTLDTTTDPFASLIQLKGYFCGTRDHPFRPGLERDIRYVYQVAEFRKHASCGQGYNKANILNKPGTENIYCSELSNID